MCTAFSFPPPEPPATRPRIHPVFLPFQGCPTRCVFCEQTLQTGLPSSVAASPAATLEIALDRLLRENAPPRELAFYGGTFTLLAEGDIRACLAVATRYRKAGLITKIRASTRPDAIYPDQLAVLRGLGLDMLEIGAQSFADAPLAAARRGYDGDTVRRACDMVTSAGLELGVQLMPGMPGMQPEDARRDMAAALDAGPSVLRLYPCLVLRGTELAAMYARGTFTPWSLEETLPVLVEAQHAAWRAGVRIIRMGLAPQAGLDQGGIVAGPRHPALGSIVRGRALLRYITEAVERFGRQPRCLAMPQRYQGEFWGHKGCLTSAYAALGLTPANVVWHQQEHCAFRQAASQE